MNKSTLRERVSVTVRGYDILKEYCPGLASGKAASALITALQPFVSLWFSAQIINELTGQRRVNLLFFYVCIVLLCNLVISMLRSVLDRITSEKQAQIVGFFPESIHGQTTVYGLCGFGKCRNSAAAQKGGRKSVYVWQRSWAAGMGNGRAGPYSR